VKLTVENYDRTITIETKHEDVSPGEFISDFVKPVMLAILYAPETVKEALGDESGPLE